MKKKPKQTQNPNKQTPKTKPKQKKRPKTQTKQTTDQKQLMGLGIGCWVACVGLKVNFWCSGHSSDPSNLSCNLRTKERQMGNLHLDECINQQDPRVRPSVINSIMGLADKVLSNM